MLDEFSRARLDRIESATDISPADLLRLVLDDIERGELDPDGVLVLICERPPDTNWSATTYRAGLTRDGELVQLELAKERLLRRWVQSEQD